MVGSSLMAVTLALTIRSYCQVEERKISGLLAELGSYPDSPDISDSERRVLSDKFSLVPRLMAVCLNSVHGLSSNSTVRKRRPDARSARLADRYALA